MDFEGFRPEDFLYFLDSDLGARVDYLKESLHPRLRDLGHELAAELRARTDPVPPVIARDEVAARPADVRNPQPTRRLEDILPEAARVR
jgi:uncharacterized protein YktB (UPF0637 family)